MTERTASVAINPSRQSAQPRAWGGAVVSLLLIAAAIFSFAVWRTLGHNPTTAPDFTLTDQAGRPFTLSSLRGHPVALFFGYTHCPDECPTTLAHLAKAVHTAGVARDTRVAFITVDPERDSAQTLRRYVGLFDSKFIGLTGDLRSLNPVYAAYHTLRRAVSVDGNRTTESFEHGTTIYYIGRDGSIDGLGQWDDAPADIVRDLRSLH